MLVIVSDARIKVLENDDIYTKFSYYGKINKILIFKKTEHTSAFV